MANKRNPAKHLKKYRFKNGHTGSRGSKNSMWKGDNVGYSGVH